MKALASVRPLIAESESAPSDWPSIPDHTVVGLISRGSYGRVWLCKSFTGRWRAAKIITRSQFASRRPFDRELAGIRRTEDLTRLHPNLNQILHVGASPNQSAFHYILELADNLSGRPITSVSDYEPKTLFHLLTNGRALPVDQCISILQGLAAGAEFLHSHGLVHRDLKPSNIVFVQGIPKISDFGLVAVENDPEIYAGTRGYLPPEGPGSRLGDVYGLGRTLFQMTWGISGAQFPELPSYASSLPDLSLRLSLNALVDHACDPNPDRRIQSAQEFLDALNRIPVVSAPPVSNLPHVEETPPPTTLCERSAPGWWAKPKLWLNTCLR